MKITTLLLGTVSLIILAAPIAQAGGWGTLSPTAQEEIKALAAQKLSEDDHAEALEKIYDREKARNQAVTSSQGGQQVSTETMNTSRGGMNSTNDGYGSDVSREIPLDRPLNPETSLPEDLRNQRDQANRGDTLWARGIEEKALEQARIRAATQRTVQSQTVTTGISGGGGMFGGIGGLSSLLSLGSSFGLPTSQIEIALGKANGAMDIAGNLGSSIPSGLGGMVNNNPLGRMAELTGGNLGSMGGAGWTTNVAKLTSLPSVAGMIPSPSSMTGNLNLGGIGGSLTAGLPNFSGTMADLSNGVKLPTSPDIVKNVHAGALKVQDTVVAGASAAGNRAATTVSTKASTAISDMTKMLPGT